MTVRLLRVGPPGRERPAVLDGEGRLFDLSAIGRDFDAAFLADGGLAEVQRLVAAGGLPGVDPGRVRIGSPVAKPEKIICIGLNYLDSVTRHRRQ